jgi:uncharacterized membrane-anchored protein YjiN (DUF445 family)
MIVTLIVTALLARPYPWLHWVRAFAEAGAIGGLADLFAVSALFRYPFGIPIPHTAIIPTNKQRIAENFGQFVEQHFLTRENVRKRLQTSNTAEAITRWLDEPATQRMLSQLAIDLIPAALSAIEERDADRFLKASLTPRLKKLDPSRLAGEVLATLAANNRHQEFFDHTLQALKRWLVANEGLVRAKFSQASAYTPGFFDKYLADKIIAGTLALLQEVAASPQHALREQFDQMTIGLIEQLETSEELQSRAQAILHEALDHLAHSDQLLDAWRKAKQHILAAIETQSAEAQKSLEGSVSALNEGILKKPALQDKLNPWLIEALEGLIARHRNQLSALIGAVVTSWDPIDVSRKIELEIGRDLQFIRINGTLAGGCAGLVLHTLTYTLGRV